MIRSRPIGIDFGAGSCRAAWAEPDTDTVVVHPADASRLVIPAIVGWDAQSSQALVGEQARQRTQTQSAPYVDLPRRLSSRAPCPLGPDEDRPAYLAAAILRELRSRVETEFGTQAGGRFVAEKAVIATPMSLGLVACEAIREGARLAGLDVLEFCPAPLAAAIGHGWAASSPDGDSLICSFGAGSFDACVVRRVGAELIVLGAAGQPFLGGIDLDRHVARWLVGRLAAAGHELLASGTPDGRRQREAMPRLATRVKLEMSTKESATLRFSHSFLDREGRPVSADLQLARADFESAIADSVDLAMELAGEAVQQAILGAGSSWRGLGQVLLVGGSTRIPLVRRRLRELLGPSSPSIPFHDASDADVVHGAALRAAAAGQGARDDSEQVQVWFASDVVAQRGVLGASGTIEPRRRDVPVPCTIRVSDGSGTLIDELDADAAGRFRLEADFQPRSGEPLVFEVLDATGLPVAIVSSPAVRTTRPAACSRFGLTSPTLHRDLALLEPDSRHVLLAAGTKLPASAIRRRPACATQQTLILLDGSQPLAGLPLQPAAGLIEILVACDERHVVTARQRMDEGFLRLELQPPPPAHPARSDPAAGAASNPADGPVESARRRRIERVRAAIMEAVACGDGPQAEHYRAELEQLIRDARAASAMHAAQDEAAATSRLPRGTDHEAVHYLHPSGDRP